VNRRTFTVLAGAAVVLALLALFSQRSGDDASIAGASAGELFAPDLASEIDRITEVQVTGGGSTRLVSLARNADGWSVAELDAYAAESAKLNGLLIALAETRIVEEKTANPDFYDRLGVEPIDAPEAAGLELTLIGETGNRHTLILGDPYGSGQRYARLADSEQSVLIDRNPEVARDPADWVEPSIIDIAASRIASVDIRHADGEELKLSKSSPEETNFAVANIPEGRELQYASIANVTGGVLERLNLEAVAAAAEPLADPVAVIDFTTFDGLVVTVDVSANGDEDPWLRFSASAAEDDTVLTETELEITETDVAATAAEDVPATQAASSEAADIAAEAAAINARLGDWRYRIADYQLSQLTRRMDDLLRALPEADE
jgi:hypothetical protein